MVHRTVAVVKTALLRLLATALCMTITSCSGAGSSDGSANGGSTGTGGTDRGSAAGSGGRGGSGAGGTSVAGSGGGAAGAGGAAAGQSGAAGKGAAGAGGRGSMGGNAGVAASAGAGGGAGAGESTGGVGGAAGATAAGRGPCDIYLAGNTPCVAAHSTVRALYGTFNGSLYQVQRSSDSATKDIPVLAPGGFASSAVQDAFCANTTCTISKIYDQSPRGNHLTPAPGGEAVQAPSPPANAAKLKLNVGGHPVYAVFIEPGMGYRNNGATGLAKGDDPESMYMVTSGKIYNAKCCFDYGNAETDNKDDCDGSMEAIYWGNSTEWGRGSGVGPWVMADLEDGLWPANVSPYDGNTPLTSAYVTALLKGKAGGFAIKGGNAQSGALKTMYEGARPGVGACFRGYNPMRKQGAIILGIGGDHSAWSTGVFFEGCITTGYASNATDDAVQANVVAAGYTN